MSPLHSQNRHFDSRDPAHILLWSLPFLGPPIPLLSLRSGREGSSTTLIKSADDNNWAAGAADGTGEDREINEKGPGEFRKYGTGNNKMRFNAEECKGLQLAETVQNRGVEGEEGWGKAEMRRVRSLLKSK